MSLGLGQDPGAAFPWRSGKDSALQLGHRREEQPGPPLLTARCGRGEPEPLPAALGLSQCGA